MTTQEHEILTKVINSNFIFSLGVVKDGNPHLCTAFYVAKDSKELYFKSRTTSEHSIALKENPNAAVSIYTPTSNYSVKSGVQCIGTVSRVTDLGEMASVVALYAKQFAGSEKKLAALPELVSEFAASTMYKFTIKKVKVLDSDQGIHSEEYIDVLPDKI